MKRFISFFGFAFLTIIALGISYPSVAETQFVDMDSSDCDFFKTKFPFQGNGLGENGIHKTKSGNFILTWMVYGDDAQTLPDNICASSNLPDGAKQQHLILEHKGRMNYAQAIGDLAISLNCKSKDMSDCVTIETYSTALCKIKFKQIFSCSYDGLLEIPEENATDFLLFGLIIVD